jgi:signal transduction histidine kinase
LFQSVRELLINSGKHAGTGQADVALEERNGQLHITVHDDGAGFDVATATAAGTDSPTGGLSSKFGLFSIRERMLDLGGSFDLQSTPGKGTDARLVLPLDSRSETVLRWTQRRTPNREPLPPSTGHEPDPGPVGKRPRHDAAESKSDF